MGWREGLFGNRPKGWGGVEGGVQGVGDAGKRGWDILRGRQPGVRVCPVCARPVEGRKDTCPVGHYVG